jgi:hypothetical protein
VSRPVDRPLTLGELLAETVHIYGERLWAALGLGAIHAGILIVAAITHPALYFVAAAVMVVVSFAVAVRLAVGDSFREAWAQAAVRLPVLLVLALVVGLPFALAPGLLFVLGLVVAAFWLGLTAFAVPVALLDSEGGGRGWLRAVAYALERTVALARTEYLHAVGVAAALILVNYLFGIILAQALVGFGDNTERVAALLTQLVLAPFFFLGLTVLYFEQRARAALSSRRQPG